MITTGTSPSEIPYLRPQTISRRYRYRKWSWAATPIYNWIRSLLPVARSTMTSVIQKAVFIPETCERTSPNPRSVSVSIRQTTGLPAATCASMYNHVFKQITNHHAWGNYQNGRVSHGLSGGNGIGTLSASRGNEASHEWGHAYGLGHYPGAGLTEDGRWQRHHADSGWGFIAHRGRMRDNLSHNSWSAELMPEGSHFQGRIPYRYDSMSGGGGGNRFSQYTHYTGYSARIIQNDLARFPIPDANFVTG